MDNHIFSIQEVSPPGESNRTHPKIITESGILTKKYCRKRSVKLSYTLRNRRTVAKKR